MKLLRTLVLLASLTACETSGLEIVVKTPDGMPAPDHVRLFIGKPPQKGTVSIAPAGFGVGGEQRGELWLRDPFNAVDIQPSSGGDAVSFGFLSDIDHAELGAVVAVGYENGEPTSAGSVFSIRTGVGNVRVFEIQLHAVDEDLQLTIWGEEVGMESCIYLHDTRKGRIGEQHDDTFIVSPHDQDCDGYPDDDPALECRANVHDAIVPPRLTEVACVIPSATVLGLRCTLGGPQCQDGGARVGDQCAPSAFCTTPDVCMVCGQSSGAQQEACIHDPLRRFGTSTMGPGIYCNVATLRDVNNMAKVGLCQADLPVALPVPLVAPPLVCSEPNITGPGMGFSDRLEIGAARFDVKVSADCTFGLKPSGEIPFSAITGAEVVSGLVAVELDNGKGIALPIEIHFQAPQTLCNAQSECVLVGAMDEVTACANVPRPPVTPP